MVIHMTCVGQEDRLSKFAATTPTVGDSLVTATNVSGWNESDQHVIAGCSATTTEAQCHSELFLTRA
jgi:hypothetical protein